MKKLIISGLALACLATVSTSALAQISTQQRTCVNDENVQSLRYDFVYLNCADLGGRMTLKEINAKGWRIVQIVPTVSTKTKNSNDIGTDIGWTVLIEK